MISKTTKIGFDLDGVFINRPPLVPKTVIEWIYMRKSNGLSYRFPGKIEQKIRIISHLPYFRPPIKHNLRSLLDLSSQRFEILLISSRFSFLRERTNKWDGKNNLFKYFRKIYFNEKDEQPYLFKDKIIKKEKINIFIDDDLDLLFYLANKNAAVDFYWLSKARTKKTFPKNITQIKTLDDFLKYV